MQFVSDRVELHFESPFGIGLRYKLGLRTYQLNNRLLLKAGYESSNASNASTDRADYDNGAWYFTGEYAF